MRVAFFIFLIGLFAIGLPAQQKLPPRRTAVTRATPRPNTTPKKALRSEAEEYKAASEKELAADRIVALKKFLTNFPNTEKKAEAQELLASSRILTAEEKLLSGDANGAAAAYKLAIEETPEGASDEFYKEQLAKIPTTLYFRGARPQAIDVAGVMEKKFAASAPRLLEVADFYLGIENASEALRVAKAAEAVAPNSAAVQISIATANRLNFDLDEAARAFAKAAELEPDSVAAKRGLADMQRAVGKPDAALPIYRELAEKNDKDAPARTGYVLTLFETGKRADAERELASALEANPGNIVLMAGAAYWYASSGDGDKAVELAKKAIDRDPRYIWSHIALARGQMAQRKPVDAEQTLIKARKYGNFPTLEYELASARLQAGFYREALDELKKGFTVEEGRIATKLGGRVARSGDDIADLIGGERRASILAANAGTSDTAAQLKQLLIFDAAISAAQPDETAVAKAADDLINATPKMKVHRQLYVANVLLQKRLAPGKVAEIAAAATDISDSAFDAPDATAAILASELYEPRATAFSRNDFLLVPEVPRQILSAIVRGRIEEAAGWALYQQEKYPEADVRLRRAISVMPDKSAWWRSSVWKLGTVLAAEGKDKEALDRYVESYKTDRPDYVKYVTIEALFRKVNGGTDGLDTLLGPERVVTSAAFQPSTPTVSTAAAETASASEPAKPEPAKQGAPAVQDPSVKLPKAVPAETAGTSSSIAPAAANSSNPFRVADVKPEPSPETKTEAVIEKPAEVKTETTEKAASVPESKPAEIEKKVDTPVGDQPAEKKAEPTVEQPIEKKSEPATPTQPEKGVETTAAPPGEKPIEIGAPAVKTGTDESKPAETDKPPVEPPKADPPKPQVTIENTPATRPNASPASTPDPGNADTTHLSATPSTSEKPAENSPAKLQVVTENNLPEKPIEIKAKPKTKPAATRSAVATAAQQKAADAMKPLFEPVVITVPDVAKKDATSENNDRPRVVPGVQTHADIEPCTVTVSQEKVSIPQGRSVALIVGIDGKGDAADLQGVASSPADIEVTAQPEIAGMEGKRLFMLKSAAALSGVFQVTFQAPCGRRDVVVTIK